jgi:hypothetical protein
MLIIHVVLYKGTSRASKSQDIVLIKVRPKILGPGPYELGLMQCLFRERSHKLETCFIRKTKVD